jgi:hypothetical protein
MSKFCITIGRPWRIEKDDSFWLGWIDIERESRFEELKSTLTGQKCTGVQASKYGDLYLEFDANIVLRAFSVASLYEQWRIENRKNRSAIENAGGRESCPTGTTFSAEFWEAGGRWNIGLNHS